MKLYRVENWDKYFENNKSRERDQCGFVCVPNKQAGLGFSRVMAHEQGAAIYGIWCLILGALSRQKKPRAGWMTDDGHDTGTPWAPADLALIFRRNEAEITVALDFLSSPQIGWISTSEVVHLKELIHSCPSSALSVPAKCPRKKEENRREKKEASAEAVSFCNWFETLIPEGMKPSDVKRQEWANAYDDLLRLDGQTKESVHRVCKWARSDEFWKKNFFSPLKLRKKNGEGISYFQVFLNACSVSAPQESSHRVLTRNNDD